MRDSEVVAAIVAGDPNGLAEAYDRYASPLYTYCRSLLREPADAADAVQDTFVIAASKLAGLRDQSRLRPWLYAVARNECHRRLREKASAATSALDLVPEMSDESADVTGGAERAELRALLRSAVRGLNTGEQELIELQLRQELDVAEIADVLGVSRNHAHALLSRARDQLEISLGALLVARSGRDHCAALNALLEDWDGQLTVLMRKRINRHIERCPECTERKRRELAPALLLGLAPVPIIAMPPGLRSQVLRLASSDTPEAVAHRAAVAQHTATFGHQGFPKPLDPPKPAWWRARQTQVAVAAAVVVAAALVLTILALAGGLGGHNSQLRALGQGSPGAGTAGGSSGGAAPGSQPGSTAGPGSGGPGSGSHSSGSPGSPTQPAGLASGPAQVSPSPAPGGTSPAPGGPSPSPSPSAASSGHSPSPSSPAPSTSSATATATSTAPATPPPAQGTLSVTPAAVTLSPGGSAILTLRASGGPVLWSTAESSGLAGEVTAVPSAGQLLAGRSTTVALSVITVASLDRELLGESRFPAPAALGMNQCGKTVTGVVIVSPGGHQVTVTVSVGSCSCPSPSPSSSQEDPGSSVVLASLVSPTGLPGLKGRLAD